MPTISGTVYDDAGAPAAGRIVRAYRRDTGALLGGSVTGTGLPIAGDPHYANVSLLLHCDGANGSTTFTDNSPAPKTVTAVGSAAISTAQSKFGGASLSLTGGFLSVEDSADLNTATGDFTIETWVRPASLSASAILFNKASDTSSGYPYQAYVSDAGGVVFRSYDLPNVLRFSIATAGGLVAVDAWTHLAFVRSGSTFTVYVNGVSAGSATYAGALPVNTNPMSIGAYSTGVFRLNGNLDDFRFTKGVARYTANFTPPTAPHYDAAELPATPVGSYGITTAYTGEVQRIVLDDDAGTLYNDLIDRVVLA